MRAWAMTFAASSGLCGLISTSCGNTPHTTADSALGGSGNAGTAGSTDASTAGASAVGGSAMSEEAGGGHGGSDGHAGSDGHTGGGGHGGGGGHSGGGGHGGAVGSAGRGESAGAGASAAGAAGAADEEPNAIREWALWPMPNPSSAGLPHSADYDTTTNRLVVQDHLTGLMWPHVLDANYHDVAGARAGCSSLSFAGYADWRLPTMIEMFSILDWTDTDPAINSSVFSTGSSGFILLWTTTSNPFYPDNGAWVMDMGSLVSMSTHPVNDRFPSFCVRGGSAEPALAHYAINADTVLDAYTGLLWERHPSFTLYTQADAAAYCDTLELAGIADWRLPSLGETASLYDFKSTGTPPMDLVAFPRDGAEVSDVDFWNAGGWRLSFWDLMIRHSNGSPTARARCVH